MTTPANPKANSTPKLEKVKTGISGFDQITGGGLPKGRPSLIYGGPGSGKTFFALEFLVHGAVEFDEPGVFITFEETAEDLNTNFSIMGYDLDELVAHKKIAIDHVYLDRREIIETGEYDLEPLFLRLGYAIDSIGAKRVAIDTIEALFAELDRESVLRSELRRLFAWLKEKGVTAIITSEADDNNRTRHGLEEYVADFVLHLQNRVKGHLATRALRIIKYRGSRHGTDEYPFLLGEDGFTVLPITSVGLNYDVSQERISTGVRRLDMMLGGKGYFRGSTVLISGSAGSGKTSLAARFVASAAERGVRSLYFAFEEAPNQIIRNLSSIEIDLDTPRHAGLLRFHAARSTEYGLENHLVSMYKLIEEGDPHIVVLDPLSNLLGAGEATAVSSMLMRLIDFLKTRGITMLSTDLTDEAAIPSRTDCSVSSLIDTWLYINFVEGNGERNRVISVLKSRGMAHSNQIRELLLSDQGIDLADVYVGLGGIRTGTARIIQEAQDKIDKATKRRAAERKHELMETRLKLLKAKIESLTSRYEANAQDMLAITHELQQEEDVETAVSATLADMRKADTCK